MDLFGEALAELYETGQATLYLERDDGYQDTEDLSWYLTSFRYFPAFEKKALQFARGRVLDVGCGAGRHSLYLQQHGFAVTAIDSSRTLVDLARRRGVRDVQLANACGRLPFAGGEFDTIMLFGNNLGFCGTIGRFRRMLREIGRVTSPQARILATSRMPAVTDPEYRAYMHRNIQEKRPIGQVRLRLTFNGRQGQWFSLLLFAPTDLLQIAAAEGWRIREVFTELDFEDGYSVVMEKTR